MVPPIGGGKGPENANDHSLPRGAVVENASSYISTPHIESVTKHAINEVD